MIARRSASRRAAPRGGFTLIELLVVIAIIATLASLTLPAVQNARATARRTECLNNIRNLGIAAQSYATSRNGNLPYLADPNTRLNWGLAATPTYAPAPWTVQLFPYMEQGPLAERLATMSTDASADYSTATLTNTKIKTLNCPDDPNSDANGNLSYAMNAGYLSSTLFGGLTANAITSGGHLTSNYDYAFNGVGLTSEDKEAARGTGVGWVDTQVKIDQVSGADGSSSTILFAENMQAQYWSGGVPAAAGNANLGQYSFGVPVDATAGTGYVVADAGTSPAGGVGAAATAKNRSLELSSGFTSTGSAGKINSNLAAAAEAVTPRASSLHSGGVNAIFVGGNGKFLSQTIDTKLYAELITWDGSRKGQKILNDTDF